MRFWLAAFVVLFAAAELLDWVAQIGSWQANGMWLVLGGMGLAALSNLSRLSTSSANLEESAKGVTKSATEEMQAAKNKQVMATETQKQAVSDDKDSISFKVRPLKR